jgi:hypothetical protein
MFVRLFTVPYSVSRGLLYVFFILLFVFSNGMGCCAPLLGPIKGYESEKSTPIFVKFWPFPLDIRKAGKFPEIIVKAN